MPGRVEVSAPCDILEGVPICERCEGRGGMRINGTWRKCECVRVTRARKDATRALNSIGAPQQFSLDFLHTTGTGGGETMAKTQERRRSRNGNGARERDEDPGFGTLFDRRKTRRNDKAPDFSTGEEPIVLEDGTELEAAVWVRKDRKGGRYVRVHIQPFYKTGGDSGQDGDEDELDDLDSDEDEVDF